MIRLTGYLICADSDEAARVVAALPQHVALTLAEPGCLGFTVEVTDNPLIWLVDESFADADSFAAHQRRAGTSDWAVQTKGIRRDYTITDDAAGTSGGA